MSALETYLDAIFGGAEGQAHISIGSDPHFDGNGRYTHKKFRGHSYAWPSQRAELTNHLVEAARQACDAYLCPYLMHGSQRAKGAAAAHPIVHADVDGTLDAQAVSDLGGFAVASGSPGHGHMYIALTRSVDAGTHRRLCEGLRDYLGGDAKIADNDVLRPPGTLNWKAFARGEPTPAPVEWLVEPTGEVIEPEDLARQLGVDLEARESDAGADQHFSAESVNEVPDWLRQRFNTDGQPDRSEAFYGLVGACKDAGLTVGQTLTMMSQWQPGVEKYGARLADQVADCWAKTRDRAQTHSQPNNQGAKTQRLEDAFMSQWVATNVLADKYCWAAGFGWLRWDGRRWEDTTDKSVTEAVRVAVIEFTASEAKHTTSEKRLRALAGLLSRNRIQSITSLAAGVVEADAATFDAKPDLLNVGNGVVDLTTGELLPHDPALRLTKITEATYRPGAAHEDWTTALGALPKDVADWMQVRIGQAATGHMTPDDVLPILQGGGSNGKTTVMATLTSALGEHAVTVPDKLLLANPGDHSTELTTLQGARFAMIEETPEARHLSVKRLKDVLGTPTITARKIRQDNVTWAATHSLFLTTNYRPRIDETDHGTWRRLALVRFPYTFNTGNGDPGLRERLRAGQNGRSEAVLAWIVEGAKRWYDNGCVMPEAPSEVVSDTDTWRGEADLIYAYMGERLVFESDAAVLSRELFEDFNEWLTERGFRPWNDQTFATRFGGHAESERHGLWKTTARFGSRLSMRNPFDPPPQKQQRGWFGVRWRTSDDDENPGNTGLSQGVTGSFGEHDSYSPREGTKTPRDTPLRPPSEPASEPVDNSGDERCSECQIRFKDGTHLSTCSRSEAA